MTTAHTHSPTHATGEALTHRLRRGWRAVNRYNPIAWYTHWLHTQWPAGEVEQLPLAERDGATNVDGLYIVGDLTGVPLLKLSVNAGHRVVGTIQESGRLDKAEGDDDVIDIAIIGGGTAGFAAAKRCEAEGLSYAVFEASEPFSTIVNFPKKKPIYTYPTDTETEGEIEFHDKSDVKEGLLEDLKEQTVQSGIVPTIARVSHIKKDGDVLRVMIPDGIDDEEQLDKWESPPTQEDGDGKVVKARAVVVAIGRSGNYRRLDVPGEDKDEKVSNRLHDPKDFAEKKVLIVGGGDSAMEAAIALCDAGADVSLSYRREEFNRPKPENIEKVTELSDGDDLKLIMPSVVKEISDDEVVLVHEGKSGGGSGEEETIENDYVFALIGREPPLDFFRKSNVRIRGERTWWWLFTLAMSILFCLWLYHWKTPGEIPFGVKDTFNTWLGMNPIVAWDWLLDHTGGSIASYFRTEGTLGAVLLSSMSHRSFYYTLAYSVTVVVFGIRRIRRRKTPYVKWQTLTLMSIQLVPLFILPEIVLPYMGANGMFDSGVGGWIGDTFFPDGSYWRAYGLILAWPLMAWNWFTAEPLWGWLILGSIQTFVLIPAMIWFWGKGVYCGWICTCGALAETLGDTQRHKMPHGPFWNRLNIVGQALLLFAVVLMIVRIVGWSTEPAYADAQLHLSNPQYDAQADVTTASVFNSEPAALRELDTVTTTPVEDRPGRTFQIAEVGGVVDDAGGVRVTLVGDASAWSDGKLEATWSTPVHRASVGLFDLFATEAPFISWAWYVDLFWAGILGVGLYFWYSGRFWCRFACPLAALMHIYARFSRFRIFADKKKCISCNQCTSVCHQGIDVMSFANKGEPMKDPECVRCSACVQECPTGVLSFGMVGSDGKTAIYRDPSWLAASPVRMREMHDVTVEGKGR